MKVYSEKLRDNFIHLLVSGEEVLLFDPAWDGPALAEKIAALGKTLAGIAITHSHADHVNALPYFSAHFPQVPVFINARERDFWAACPHKVRALEDGEALGLPHFPVTMMATPGHTPGSSCYLGGGHVFSGDTLFVYGCGRADFHGGDVVTLFHSLQKIKKLPANWLLHPGHDYGIQAQTTLGEQLAHNPFLMIDRLADFVRFRSEIAPKLRRVPYTPMRTETLKRVLS